MMLLKKREKMTRQNFSKVGKKLSQLFTVSGQKCKNWMVRWTAMFHDIIYLQKICKSAENSKSYIEKTLTLPAL
jgi:hypothetical protein